MLYSFDFNVDNIFNMDGITLLLGGIFCFLYGLNMLFVQTRNITQNITTNESINWNHYPYLRNRVYFNNVIRQMENFIIHMIEVYLII